MCLSYRNPESAKTFCSAVLSFGSFGFVVNIAELPTTPALSWRTHSQRIPPWRPPGRRRHHGSRFSLRHSPSSHSPSPQMPSTSTWTDVRQNASLRTCPRTLWLSVRLDYLYLGLMKLISFTHRSQKIITRTLQDRSHQLPEWHVRRRSQPDHAHQRPRDL